MSVLIAISIATFLHWAVLILRFKTLLVITGWKWYFQDKVFQDRVWLFLLLALCMILLVIFISRHPRPIKRNLLMLISLGFALQVCFGYLQGQGFTSLRDKYANSVFNRYAKEAATDPGILNSITHYESLYAKDWYLGTKPPGVLLVYNVTQKISNLVDPQTTDDGRFLCLTTLIAYVFPLVAMLILVILFLFVRSLGEDDPYLPGILYLVLPNVLLIPLFLDQAIYPAVFMLVLYVTLKTIQGQSLRLALATGSLIFLAGFLSFSLLPLLPLCFLWVLMDFLANRQGKSWLGMLKILLSITTGILVMLILFRVFLNYDVFTRFSAGIGLHRQAKDFQPGLQQVLDSIFLNNSEMITWVGLPVTILFMMAVCSSIVAFIRRSVAIRHSLLVSFLATSIGLNIFGQTNGEVQRLWLFFTPLVVIFAAREASHLLPRKNTGIILIIIFQLVITLLIFRFQDFYG